MSRRALLFGGSATLALATAGYSYGLEPRRLIVERISITLPKLPEAFDGFKIAQLTDFHAGPFVDLEHLRNAADLCAGERPDAVVLTGDFVSLPSNDRSAAYAEPCAEMLRRCCIGLPAFAILGNHDHYIAPERVTDVLRTVAHAEVLLNRAAAIERGGARLWLYGIDDALVRRANLQGARALVKNDAVILLAHEPDVADEAAQEGFMLQLSGHSHGGQVRLPFIGAPILPPLGRKYPAGLYRVGDMQLYTSRGVGLIAPPVRFNCPPEVTIITLQSR